MRSHASIWLATSWTFGTNDSVASTWRSQSGKNVSDSALVDANFSTSDAPRASSCASRRPAERRRMISSAVRRNASPAGVRLTACVVRSNSAAPAHTSSALILRLSAGCDEFRCSAAREKLRVDATAMKSCSQLISMAPALLMQILHNHIMRRHWISRRPACTLPASQIFFWEAECPGARSTTD